MAIRGTNTEKLSQIEIRIIKLKRSNYPLQKVKEIPPIKVKHRSFENSFFPATITEWNDLDYSLCNVPSIIVFKKNILKFIRLGPYKVFNINNPHGLKLLTRLRLGLSHLCGHKFNHNFSDCLDEICMCGKDIKSKNHLLLHCSLFLEARNCYFLSNFYFFNK